MKAHYTYIHPACGKPAFLLLEMPVSGDTTNASMAMHLDGSQIRAGDDIVCDSCGKRIWPLATEHVRKWEPQ